MSGRPVEGFPEDLSIVATLRPAQGVDSVLFAVYNNDGDEQLVVTVGKTVVFNYFEGELSRSTPIQAEFPVAINDGKSVLSSYQSDVYQTPKSCTSSISLPE